jgi:cold shock CspA family protein
MKRTSVYFLKKEKLNLFNKIKGYGFVTPGDSPK